MENIIHAHLYRYRARLDPITCKDIGEKWMIETQRPAPQRRKWADNEIDVIAAMIADLKEYNTPGTLRVHRQQ